MSGAAPKRAPQSIDEQMRYESGCLGKDHYPSKSAAEAGLKDLLQHSYHDARRHLMHVYECEFCPDEWVYGHGKKRS